MIHDRLRAVIAKRIALHPEDDFQIDKCWKEEVALLTEDIDEAIDFILNHGTDEEIYWLSEIFEDVVHSVNSMPFVEAIIERANTIYDEAKKKSVLSEAEYARTILGDNP